MANRRFAAVECTLAPGVFACERFFKVKMANGEDYYGIAQDLYCWNEQGQIVGSREPVGQAPGKVAARIVDVEDLPEGQVAIEVPDGKVIAVGKHQIGPRPTEIKYDVPIGSRPGVRSANG
jgi:hypothetical protein